MSEPAPLIIVDRADRRVLILRLNRPERRNALSTTVLQEIAQQLKSAALDAEIRAVVITGGDTVFAAGADLDEMALATSADALESPRFLAWQAIRQFPKPLIAAVEGWCLGAGCELMLCCDIAISGAGARFGQPETNLAIMPGAGGTSILPRRIGMQRAMMMVLTGQPVDAEQAFAIGLIATIVAAGQALEKALTLAQTVADRAPLALMAAKSSIRLVETLDEETHIRRERALFLSLMDSKDKIEGIAAFKEKRMPVWSGS